MHFLDLLLLMVYYLECISAIQGTWQSQSGKVITGESFFEPKEELIHEPELPGISYSFDNKGHYESAHYFIIANNKNHSCPKAILSWQHGNYKFKKGKLILKPIENDGRQLISDPCFDYGISEYKRFIEGETLEVDVSYDLIFQNFKIILVDYLTGKKKQPMWLTLTNATMLPPGIITSKKKIYVNKE